VPTQAQPTSNAQAPASPARDTDLVSKIGAFQLIMSENVYDHRPGSNGGKVDTLKRVITVDDPKLNTPGNSQPGTQKAATPGFTTSVSGKTQLAPTSVNNIASILQKKAKAGPRTKAPDSPVRPVEKTPPTGKAEERSGPGGPVLQPKVDSARLRELEQQRKQREQQKRQLEQEAAQLKAESSRINNWRQDLQRRMDDLRSRIRSHNQNRPDPSSASAVNSYNNRADRLEREQADLRAEMRRFDDARRQLQNRAQQFDSRVKTLLSQPGH
jgi:hypothetical protein